MLKTMSLRRMCRALAVPAMLALLLITIAVESAHAVGTIIPATSPFGPTSLQSRARWGNTGYEGGLFIGGTVGPTLNPAGTPVWVIGDDYKVEYTYTVLTGDHTLKIDFNKDNIFGAGEVITQSTSFANQGFQQFGIFMSGSATRGIELSNFVVNGTIMPNYVSPATGNIDLTWENSAGYFEDITATGSIKFTGVAGPGDETGRIWFRTAKPVAALPCAALSMPSQSTLTGLPITVPVNNTVDMVGRGTISADFRVTYNDAVLDFTGATLGTVGNSNGGGRTLTITENVSGTLVISVYGTSEFQGAGSLVDLNFNVIGLPATSSPVNFTAFNYNEGLPCSGTTNGTVNVISGTITGEVTYGNAILGGGPSPRHVPGTTLNAVGSINQSAVTALDGTYTLSGMGAGSYVVTPSKTGDDQSALTGLDSACIAQYVVAQAGGCMTSPGFPTSAQTTVADVSGSGTITSFDAALIARYAAALPGYGNTGQWRFTPTTRSYLNVNTNQTGQNYVALLMGDVTGNWINGLATRPAPIFPEGERPMRISAPSISAPVGTEITVPVDIQDTTGKGILSYEFDLRFDPTVLEPAANTVDLTGTIGEGQMVTVNSLERGRIRVVVYGTNVLAGEGHLLKLKFNVIGDVNEASDLTWTTFNINEGGINFETRNGRVVVRAAANDAAISGRVLRAAGEPVAGATVILTDTNGQTRTARASSLGHFRFAELTVGQSYTINVSAKRYTFASQTVSVTDGIVNLDLIAEQ